MSSWKKVRLGDYIHEYSKRNKDNANIPVYSVTNINGFCTEYFSKEVASKDKTTYKIVKKGFFAYNPSRINVGSVDWLRDMDRVIVSPLYNVFFVDSALDQQYLYYYLKCPVGLFYIKELASGSVRDNLKFSILSDFIIPFPDLTIQKDIAATLDRIVQIINICNTILDKIDLLVKSRFVEMFGDPNTNSMGWECCELGDCLESIDNGKSYVCDNYCRTGDNPAILKLSAVTYGVYNPDENKAMIDEDLFDESSEVKDSDLLFTRKNTPDLVGMSAYVFSTPPKLMMPDLIFRLNVKSTCNKKYLWKLINHDLFRPLIQNIANGSAKSMSNISKERLSKLTIPVPPLTLQKQFADCVAQTDKSKLAVKQILEKAETLKKSLMQEYFG